MGAITKKAPAENEIEEGGHPTRRGPTGWLVCFGFTFLHAIVKRVEKWDRLRLWALKNDGGRGGGAVTLTHTRDIRQKKDPEDD